MTMFIQNGAPEGLTERWSLRLKGYIKPVTQDTQFQFGVTVNGRAKLYIDGELVVDNWTKQVRGVAFFGSGTVEERGVVELKAGKKHEIYVDFCNVRGPAGDHTDNMVYVGGSAVRIGGAQILDQEKAIAESCALAKQADVAVVVVGLNGDWETEGYDRTSLKLPGATNELVTRVLQANPRTVIVTQCVRHLLLHPDPR
jgi:beta-glucosidase